MPEFTSFWQWLGWFLIIVVPMSIWKDVRLGNLRSWKLHGDN